MGIKSEDLVSSLLNKSNEREVLGMTGIAKSAWGRNGTVFGGWNDMIHYDVPDASLVESYFDCIKRSLDERLRRHFSSFIDVFRTM